MSDTPDSAPNQLRKGSLGLGFIIFFVVSAAMLAVLGYDTMQFGLYGLFGAAASGLFAPLGLSLPWWLYAAPRLGHHRGHGLPADRPLGQGAGSPRHRRVRHRAGS